MKLNATNRNTLTAIVIVFCLLSVLMTFVGARVRSEYQPRPINIETSEEGEASIFDLEHSIDCVPGSKKSAYYTKSLSPGGICGDQAFVRKSADAKIIGGIGGSLI
jgi:hypothetical protein